MGTTVTALLLAEGKLHFAHIGDSRAYRLRNGEFEQVSVDHTFVQRLIDEGRLRPEEAETHPHKNVLMRVLGDVDASPELDLDTLDVEPGERWLLCSDGLNYVAGHVVERTVRETKDLRECVELLVDLTLEAGAPDNVTVVMLEIAEQTTDDVRTAAVEIVPARLGRRRDRDRVRARPRRPEAPLVQRRLPKRPGRPTAPPADAGGAAAAPTAGEAAAAGPPSTRDPRLTPAPAEKPADSASDEAEPATTTDPHLGEHLSAEVLREELSGRPHELVGAAAAAAESGSIPTIAGRTMARRAATVLTHKSEQAREEAEEYRPAGRPRRWVTVVHRRRHRRAADASGLWLGYAWTQTRYYIGEHDQHVAIFNGVSQRLGPIQLSTLEAVTDIRMSDLPEFSQQRVRQTVPGPRSLRRPADRQEPGAHRHHRPGGRVHHPVASPATAAGAPALPAPRPSPGATASPGAASPAPPATVAVRHPGSDLRGGPNDTHRPHAQAATEHRTGPPGPGPRRRHRRQRPRGRGPAEGVRHRLLVPVEPARRGRPRLPPGAAASAQNMPIR